MKKALALLLCVFFCAAVSAQNLTKTKVDRLVDTYTSQEKYDSASLVLITFANQEHQKGNLETALEYQIKNCKLIEQYTNYFIQRGFTLRDFFNNYGMVFVLQRDLGNNLDAISTYLELANIIIRYSPSDLPFYTNLIASTLGECTNMPLADSVYCLQKALNIIKQQEVTEDNIKKYLWFCRCFNTNRMYNSFDNHAFIHNSVDEIENWYLQNSPYVHELDKKVYQKEILAYDFEYADLLYLFAGAVGAQKKDLLGAIDLYSKEISILSSMEIEDDLKNLKIASCYAKIADNYYQLGDVPMCKQYCDKAFPFVMNPTDNNEYCDVLSALANIYYNTNQPDLAAKLKLDEIRTREITDGTVSLTDWGQYFLYIVDTNPDEVILQNRKLNNIRIPEGGNTSYFLTIGKA